MQRLFVSWDRSCLDAACELLLARYARAGVADMTRVTAALPGRRATRRLMEKLIDLAEARSLRLLPPRIVTVGALPDLMFDAPRPLAGEATRILAWMQALDQVGADRLRPFVGAALDDEGPLARTALAEQLDRLHTDLAGACLDFADVAERGGGLPTFDEAERWQALADVQRAYLQLLQRMDLADGQHERIEAASNSRCRTAGDIVLIAAADLNVLQRRVLEQVHEQVTVLVHAPESMADRFDEFGCAVTDAWTEVRIDLAADQLMVVERPADQAAAALRHVASLGGQYTAEQITIGVGDEQIAPHLQQHLSSHGLTSHYAAGEPVDRTRPCRLLTAVAEYLDRRTFAALATLVRHSDMEHVLLTASSADSSDVLAGIEDWLGLMDRYYNDHLQGRLTERWLGDPDIRQRLKMVYDAVHGALGDLTAPPQTLSEWSQPILHFLLRVYGDEPLDREDAQQWAVVQVCDGICAVLQEHFALPEAVSASVTASEAIRLLLRQAQDQTIAPEPAAGAIEMLGWLELALDDAPALIVTGFNEGRIPASVSADAFLPDALRRHLGLLDNQRRYARDAYLLSAILATRPRVHLIAGRTSADQEPLTPSRLLLATAEDELPDRVLRFYGDHAAEPQPTVLAPGMQPAERSAFDVPPPPKPLNQPITVLPVTAFRSYLACPYRFYLRYVLGLEAMDDAALELAPSAFGSLAHQVLRDFARSDAADATDAATIRRLLDQQLDARAAEQFGPEVLPTVRVQIEQLRVRLGHLAEWQAEWAAQGWRIAHSEMAFSRDRPGTLIVDGQPMHLTGRIDRVDRHVETGRWAVIDYKSGEKAIDAGKAHRAPDGSWTDLQLPLYCRLIESAGLIADAARLVPDQLQLGYVLLPRDVADVGPSWTDWGEAELLDADAVAADVVRAIRAEKFWPPAEDQQAFDDFATICGVDQLVPETGEEGES